MLDSHLFLQVLNLAWDRGLSVAGENALSCYDREGWLRIVEMVKPRNDPDRHHFSFFVYQQPSPLVQGTICFPELGFFIKCMHGKYLLFSHSNEIWSEKFNLVVFLDKFDGYFLIRFFGR